ncbi:hypothetical protein YC2023_083237 [Brassica napus]
MWAWSGVSRWCIRFHPCPVSVCVSDQGKMFQPLWLSCDVVAVHSMFRVVLQQFEKQRYSSVLVVCGEYVKVMVVEMKMVSGFLFIFRLQRSFSHTLNKFSSWVLLVSVIPLWLHMMK